MATGLRIPVGVNANGGAALVSDDEQAEKVIGLAINDNDTEHPFHQDEGLGQFAIFKISDGAIRAQLQHRILRIFEAFDKAKLYRLDRDSISWTKGPKPGELTLELTYVNLETDEPRVFRRSFLASGR